MANKLSVLGYEVTRQNGSHIRLTTQQNDEHHITVPKHDPLKMAMSPLVVEKILCSAQSLI
ncbi:type II toxin-antitoxin system HicA family toxin [Methylovulum miyakonense]|uniref:type II toxin-antitoxin system HicA family toxin n=1 Tax=Methylovulum miyakonense TaxID=645578 RepID=UPI001E4E2E8E|nr:type II toxin-antitoxin system HicA family toxin [Methylovulum miyakonense]